MLCYVIFYIPYCFRCDDVNRCFLDSQSGLLIAVAKLIGLIKLSLKKFIIEVISKHTNYM